MKLGIIYRATCLITGKSYIGKTVNSLERRKKEHQKEALKENTKFYRAIKKYGFEKFKWEVLKNDILSENLDWTEIWFITTFDTKVNGYNTAVGGSGGDTFSSISPKKKMLARQKMSKNNAGENNPNFGNGVKILGNKNPMFGRSVFDVWVEKYGTEEAKKLDRERRQKSSLANIKRFSDPKEREKLKGKNCFFFGKPGWNRGKPAWNRQEKINLICLHCNQEFTIRCLYFKDKRKFCSRKCSRRFQCLKTLSLSHT